MQALNELELQEQTAPPTPPAGYVVLYTLAGGALAMKDDEGTVTILAGTPE